jgi:hypothetical protein
VSALDAVLARIDALHDEDPIRVGDRGRELVYAEAMTRWLARLCPDASDALRVAVRAQHLARWRSPRAAFPDGRVGYLQWRKDAGARHAETARAILLESGLEAAFGDRVAALVMKKDRTRDAESQSLEDCACLVFLELDFEAFAAEHDDDAVVEIVKKTWGKMSPEAHEEAVKMALSARGAELVARALAASG